VGSGNRALLFLQQLVGMIQGRVKCGAGLPVPSLRWGERSLGRAVAGPARPRPARSRGIRRWWSGKTLRPLQVDRSGNAHRSEISLDKFWSPAWPAGCQGLIEFRATNNDASRALECGGRPPVDKALHDRMPLPSALWQDLSNVLASW